MSKQLQQLRLQAFKKQDGLCYYCGQHMWYGHPPSDISAKRARFLLCTAEHLTARLDGGCSSSENIVAACYWCNSRRHFGRPHAAPLASRYKDRVAQLMARGKWHPAVVRSKSEVVRFG